jgi:hypothetical protein
MHIYLNYYYPIAKNTDDMNSYIREIQTLPQEIKSIVSSIDISKISKDISTRVNLDDKERDRFEQNLRHLLASIWKMPEINAIGFLPMGLDGKKREVFYQDINSKVFRPIIRMLHKAGLNEKDILYENNNVSLTALTINGYPTSNVKIMDKINEFSGLSISSGKAIYKLSLKASNSGKNLWDDFAGLAVSFHNEEELRKFKEQLSIARKVGKFVACSKQFSKWAIQTRNRKTELKKISIV